MAELTQPNPCCAPAEQETCCEPADKASCCDSGAHAEGSCGCQSAEQPDVRETVRERYAAAARLAAGSQGGCCGTEVTTTNERGEQVFGEAMYDAAETDGAPEGAVQASLGCGVPTAVADLALPA